MKVILVNGSPHAEGCTHAALAEVMGALQKHGIDAEIFHIGALPLSGCLGCRGCAGGGGCVIKDAVNDFALKAKDAAGFIFGSPVHYAAAAGAITSFMDRLFYAHGRSFRGKPAAAVVSCRRAGSTAALDQLNKYFTISGMPVVSSVYWNMVHGQTPADVAADAEGMQVMRALGANMAWLLKCIEAGRRAGIEMPAPEQRIFTNFIR
jgi:multimeric flavodoxin WrbA